MPYTGRLPLSFESLDIFQSTNMDCFNTISLFSTIFNSHNSLSVSFSTHYSRITWIEAVQVEKADVGLKRFKISSLRGKNVVINQEKKCDTARTQGEGSGSLSGKSGRLAANGYTCQGFVPVFGPCRVLQRRLLKKKRSRHWRIKVPFWTLYKGFSRWDWFFFIIF